MSVIDVNGVQFEVDEDGFIQEPDKWSEALAEVIAKTEDVPELTEDHWKVINYLRDYYQAIRDRADDPQALQRNRIPT